MAHTPKLTIPADDHIPDVAADPDTQADGLERLMELAKEASPETRARMERTIAVIAYARQIRSLTLKAAEQATLVTEAHSMDEERRSLAELHIGGGGTRQ
jgi:hypothetical protein